MTPQELQDALHTVLSDATVANFDDSPEIELPAELEQVDSVETYRDAGILTTDAGVVVRTKDGREFQISIVRSR
jgi:hypothetical protein